MMKYLLLSAVFSYTVFAKCPNACNGHGACNIHDQCTCFNEEGDGVKYLASDEHLSAICFNHGTDETKCANEKTDPNYLCAFDKTDNTCKRIVKDNAIVPGSKTQFAEWTGA